MCYTHYNKTYEKSYRKHPAQWTYKSLQTYALYKVNMNRTANFLYIKMFYVFHKHLRDILLFVVVNCPSKQLSCQCQITDGSQHVQWMRIENKSMETISCHSNKSSYPTGIKNLTFVEGNVLCKYAKFQLHPPYDF